MTTTAPSPSGTRGRRVATGLRVVVGAAVVAGSAALLLPDRLGLDGRLPFTALVALRPAATGGVAAVAVLSLAARRRWWPTMVPVLAICAVAGSFLVPRVIADDPAPAPGRELSLLSFNVFEGGADLGAVGALLRERRPDLVVLPESAQRYRALVTAAVPEMGYRSWVAAGPGGADVDGVTVLAAPSVGDLAVRTLDIGVDPWLELTGGALGATRLVAVHTAAPVPGKIESWPGELAAIGRWCGDRSGAGAVIAGDFNATLDHSAFRAGIEGCRDTGEATGKGLTATWNARWPRWFGAQIDHVLTTTATPGAPTTRGLEILDVPGSDHRALFTTVVLP